jgi:hypothetical protein
MSEWDVGTSIAIGLGGFLLVWYVVGLQRSRWRSVQVARQVRDSIQPFGGPPTVRLIGRHAFGIEVEKPAPPFSALQVSFFLASREAFFLWLFGRRAGRRDSIVLSAGLAAPGGTICEVYHPEESGAAESVREVQELGWKPEPVPGRPELLCAAPDPAGRALAQEVMALLRGIEVWRVRVRTAAPHLEVALPLSVTEPAASLAVFGLLPQLAALAAACGSAAADGSA